MTGRGGRVKHAQYILVFHRSIHRAAIVLQAWLTLPTLPVALHCISPKRANGHNMHDGRGGHGDSIRQEKDMEYIALYRSECPYCNYYIEPGDSIKVYRRRWFHADCFANIEYIPPSRNHGTGHQGLSAQRTAQERTVRDSVGRSMTVMQRNEKIRRYKQAHPYMSIRELAEYLGLAKSTVHRVLAQQ